MTYKIEGKVKEIFGTQKGHTPSGEWMSREFIVSARDGEYDRDYGFHAGSRVIDQVNLLKVGDTVSVEFYIASRVYNGRIYNDLRVVSINHTGTQQSAPDDMPDDLDF